jgi:hypothetical protein
VTLNGSVTAAGKRAVSALPSTLVIAPDSKIAGRVIGATSVQDLRRLIKAAALRPS